MPTIKGAPVVTCNANLVRSTPDSRFTTTELIAGQAVVSDSGTGLMWKKCSQGFSGSTCSGSATALSWADAVTAADAENHAGFSDWRLPNVQELNSLVETACNAPSVNSTFFPDIGTIVGPTHYWASTTFVNSVTGAHRVDFSSGALGWAVKTDLNYVRLVRGGGPGHSFDSGKDFTPDAFAFAAQSGVPVSTTRTSASITLAGLTTATGVRVTGASGSLYSLNGGAYTSAPGWVSNGDQLTLRHVSAATRGVSTTSTLTIGGVSADFSSTTEDVPGAPTSVVATAGDSSASIAFAEPASNGGHAISGYTATSTPGGFSSSACLASPCSVSGLSNGVAYTFTVTATNSLGAGTPSAASNSIVPKANQTISFGAPPTLSVGSTASVSATGGGSGNPVVFSSLTAGVCSVSGSNGSVVSGLSAGACSIAANQAGSASFNAAAQVTQEITVGKGEQAALSLLASPSSIPVGATSTLTVSGGSGNGANSFSVTSGASSCSLSGNNVLGLAAGDCTITATKAADSNYNSATATAQVRVFAGQGVDLGVSIQRVQPAAARLDRLSDKGMATLANYRITVRNNGPENVAGVQLQASAGSTLLNPLWSCTVPGPPCTPVNGAGAVDTVFDLEVGQAATTDLSGTINTAQNFVEVTAHATPPAGTNAVLTTDDRQTLTEPAISSAVYRNGME